MALRRSRICSNQPAFQRTKDHRRHSFTSPNRRKKSQRRVRAICSIGTGLSPNAKRSSAKRSGCRCFRRRRSVRSRRPRRSGKARAAYRTRQTGHAEVRGFYQRRDRKDHPLPGRSQASTCSFMASPSATTWSNISAKSCPGSRSPRTVGFKATDRDVSNRRSFLATSNAQTR